MDELGFNYQFARKVRAWRKHLELGQDAFAYKLGITQPCVSHYENGRRTPALFEFSKLCQSLGMTMDEFMNGPLDA